MSADETEPPTDDLLAAELVLGVVDASQCRSLQTRADSDRAFAERVAYWEQRFAPWLNDIEAVQPPARVWMKIRRRLGWMQSEQLAVNPLGSLVFWRTATALAAIVAVIAIGMLVQRAQPPVTGKMLPQGQAVTAL